MKKIGPFKMPIAIIRDWHNSPWIIINPERGGLIGRDIFTIDAINVNITSDKDRTCVKTYISKDLKGEKK